MYVSHLHIKNIDNYKKKFQMNHTTTFLILANAMICPAV